MAMNWLLFLPLILAATLALMFWPLFSRRGHTPLPVGLEGNRQAQLSHRKTLLLRQLKELELDAARGLVEEGDARAVRIELEQELTALLAELDSGEPAGNAATMTEENPLALRLDKVMGLALMLFVVVTVSGLYLLLGTPRTVAPAMASPHKGDKAQIAAMVERLAERLRANPDDPEGWMRLGRSYMVMGRTNEAIEVYSRIVKQWPDQEDAQIALAELLVRDDNAANVSRGTALLEQLLVKDPDHPDALWYLGGLAYRSGRKETAIAHWQHLLSTLEKDDPNRPTVEGALQQAQNLP
ncbi:MAG: c-type cytochrome biogenesis protein CcmI [Magnetococcales bacterium]|nr:c-type cytochrome biogenesis protein CcmI [Magnetococcales bacterium]